MHGFSLDLFLAWAVPKDARRRKVLEEYVEYFCRSLLAALSRALPFPVPARRLSFIRAGVIEVQSFTMVVA